MHWFVVTCSRLNPEHDCHWHNNCFKNRHDWATNCWKIGACSNVECDSSMCNWQVFLMNHHTAKPSRQQQPHKTNRMTNLEGIADFLLCCLMALDFCHRPAPPPPRKKITTRTKIHIFGLSRFICLFDVYHLVGNILKPHVFLWWLSATT